MLIAICPVPTGIMPLRVRRISRHNRQVCDLCTAGGRSWPEADAPLGNSRGGFRGKADAAF